MLPAHRATKLIFTFRWYLAGWLRYLEGVDDNGSEFTLSPDSNIEHVRALMGNPKLGDDVSARLSCTRCWQTATTLVSTCLRSA